MSNPRTPLFLVLCLAGSSGCSNTQEVDKGNAFDVMFRGSDHKKNMAKKAELRDAERAHVEELEKKVEQSQTALNAKLAARNAAKTQLDQATAEQEAIHKQLEHAKQEEAASTQANADGKARVAELEKQLAESNARVDAKRRDIAQLESDIAIFQKVLDSDKEARASATLKLYESKPQP